MISSDFFNCEGCPALPESAACLSCTLYMDDSFDDDKEKSFENIDIDGNVIETDFNHAFNEGFVDGDISPIPDYSNECHDLL